MVVVSVAGVARWNGGVATASISISSVSPIATVSQQGVAEAVDAADACSKALSEAVVDAAVETVEFTLVETILLALDKAVEGSLQVSVMLSEDVAVGCSLVETIDCSFVVTLHFTLDEAGLLSGHEPLLLTVEFPQCVRINIAAEAAHHGVAESSAVHAANGGEDRVVELHLGGLDGLDGSGWVTQHCRQAHRQHHEDRRADHHDHRVFPETKETFKKGKVLRPVSVCGLADSA